MKLRQIAHSRTGDKGNVATISVIAFDERDYPFIAEHVTAALVAERFRGDRDMSVTRYELPTLCALNCRHARRLRAAAGSRALWRSTPMARASVPHCSISICRNRLAWRMTGAEKTKTNAKRERNGHKTRIPRRHDNSFVHAVHRASPGRVRSWKFAPQSDVAILDPIMSVSYVTRNHAMLIFDTLYGADEHNRAQPQMIEGHLVEQDGRQWTLTLREGLRFHDGSPVLARDVVASVKRWWKRDNVGQVLAALADELSAVSDRAVRFRLKAPFPMLPDALGKFGTNNAVIMPERLALTEATVQVTEMTGSGPYRFVAGERVPGSRLVYEKFAD